MNVKKTLFAGGSILLVFTLTLLLLEPSIITVDPDPRFDTEITSQTDGTTEFKYVPVGEDSHNVFVTYTARIDGEVTETVTEQNFSSVSATNPITVRLNAEPDQSVSVDMTIQDSKGKVLHKSNNMIDSVTQ